MKESKRNHIIITLFGVMVVSAFLSVGNIFGSSIDWLGQHSVFPDVFRQNFYQTGRLVPNFIFDIGSGQNVYNFAYYGFLSPFVLISYLVPFVNMTTYIAAMSIIIYIVSGNLVYKFAKNHFNSPISLYIAMAFMAVSPIFIQYHRHIMYVWYMPFLILSFIGLDRLFEKKKCGLFVLSTVCIILTNYYFSVGCLISLFIYAVYRLLQDEEISFKTFIRKFFLTGCLFLLPVLICAFLLLPTASALIANNRPYRVPITPQMLLVPQMRLLFYDIHSYGLTLSMFIALLGNLSCKGLGKSDRFLNITLLVLLLSPVFPFALNGMLYIRSKVMIPFVILYLYNFVLFVERLKKGEPRMKIPLIITGAFILSTFWINLDDYLPVDFIWYVLAAAELVLFKLFIKDYKRIYIYTLVVMYIALIGGNVDSHYVRVDEYQNLQVAEIEDMLEKYGDSGTYRTNVAYKEEFMCNRSFGSKFYGTSAYSSTPHKIYLDFYDTYMGNNEQEINSIIVTGAKNELFYSFMGTRYTFAQQDPGFFHEKVAEGEKLNMYENKLAYPLAYKSKRFMSEAEFDKLQFPYTAEVLMTHTICKEDYESDYKSVIKKHDVESSYRFNTWEMPGYNKKKQALEYTMELGEEFRNKVLYLRFNLDNKGEFYNEEHLRITINGICNTLSYDWTYYNGNTKFDYVIPLEDTTTLSIKVTNGKYRIYDLEMYSSDVIYENYTGADNITFDKSKDRVTCSVNAREGEYLVTSIPYDKGFSAQINGEDAKVELINKAFVGIKLKDGKNDIVLSYRSPLQDIGFLISALGVLVFLAVLFRERISALMKKYREILLYLVFGVLTTVISIVTYFIATDVFLNPEIPIQMQAANIISWVFSVSFAYVTNKIFVFESRGNIVKEVLKFFSSRLGTLAIEMVLMYLIVSLGKISDLPAKVFVQLVVIVTNYVLSKMIVFKEKKN